MINIPPPLLEALLSLLRSCLIAAGAYLVGKGWLDAGIVEPLAAVIVIAAPMAWGAWQKYQADRKAREAIDAAAHAPREVWTDEQRAAAK